MKETETIPFGIAPESTGTEETDSAFQVWNAGDVRRAAKSYHDSSSFTADMSAAFKKAAQQAQIENAKLEESP